MKRKKKKENKNYYYVFFNFFTNQEACLNQIIIFQRIFLIPPQCFFLWLKTETSKEFGDEKKKINFYFKNRKKEKKRNYTKKHVFSLWF